MDENLESGLEAFREYKDSVFSLLLDGDEVAARAITNTFVGTNYGPDTPVRFTTLRNSISKRKLNDLSFIIGDQLIILIEHQSTLNENMPFRIHQFYAETMKVLHAEKDMYREEKFTIQRPKFLVFYNGTKKMDEDMRILRLSDMFAGGQSADGTVDLELTVKMYNINDGRNADLLKSCTTLREYSIFIGMVREYQKTMGLNEAVQKAVVDCIDKNVLKEFLLNRKGEVVNMLTTEFNMDLALEVKEEEGANRKSREIAKKMLARGDTINSITEVTGLTVDDILQLMK